LKSSACNFEKQLTNRLNKQANSGGKNSLKMAEQCRCVPKYEATAITRGNDRQLVTGMR